MNNPSLSQDNLNNMGVGGGVGGGVCGGVSGDADLVNTIRSHPSAHKKIYGDKHNGYAEDPITGVRLRPKNIHKIKCGHYTTKNTFNKMVRKSPKTYSKEHNRYVLQCAVCRDIIHICNY